MAVTGSMLLRPPSLRSRDRSWGLSPLLAIAILCPLRAGYAKKFGYPLYKFTLVW